MTSTMFGFQCLPCRIVGWPATDACPKCDLETDPAEVEISADAWRLTEPLSVTVNTRA